MAPNKLSYAIIILPSTALAFSHCPNCHPPSSCNITKFIIRCALDGGGLHSLDIIMIGVLMMMVLLLVMILQ